MGAGAPRPNGTGPAGTTLADAAIRNLIQSVSGLAQTYTNIQGAQNRTNITSATLVKNGTGRICTVIVTSAGSAPGAIYDNNQVAATTNLVWNIPTTKGVYGLSFPMGIGIVVAPGSGQVVSVSFS